MSPSSRRWCRRFGTRFARTVAEAESLGWTFETTRGGHVGGFCPDGQRRWTGPATPNRSRMSTLNSCLDLRRALARWQQGAPSRG